MVIFQHTHVYMCQLNAVSLFQVKWKHLMSSYPCYPFPVCTSYILRKTRLSYWRDRDLPKLLSAPWYMVCEGPAPEHLGNPKLISGYVSCMVHNLVWYYKYRPYHPVLWFSSQQGEVGEMSAKFRYLTGIHHMSETREISRAFCVFLCLFFLSPVPLLSTHRRISWDMWKRIHNFIILLAGLFLLLVRKGKREDFTLVFICRGQGYWLQQLHFPVFSLSWFW